MKTRKLFVLICCLMGVSINANAQKLFQQILGGVLQGAAQGIEVGTLNRYINNSSIQSADMKNYLYYYRNGCILMEQNDYYNAAQNYAKSWLIANGTKDQYLKTLWVNYGWAQDTNKKLEYACSLAGIDLSSSGGGAANYSSGYTNSYSGSSTSTTTTSSRVCSLCNGTGLKIKESYVGASQRKYCATCGKQVSGGHSHVRCDMCSGTGRLNY